MSMGGSEETRSIVYLDYWGGEAGRREMEDKEARGSDGRMLGRVGEGKSKVKTSAISFILSALSRPSFTQTIEGLILVTS